MNPASVARAITHPVHTAGSLAGRTLGVTLGAARIGVRTTARVVGWAVERAGGPTPRHPSDTYSPVTVPPATAERAPEPTDLTTPQSSDDPMRPTVTPPRKTPARTAPAKKVPASEVPVKSAPTPSLPAGVEALDDAVDNAAAPPRKAAAKKPATKKSAPRKAAAKKAPSKQAAVLAPALGLSESEVAEVVGDDSDDG